ncbi:MAG TPA: tripartite tricarboxylate transporter permease, partial [Burkholderiales bacterium]|nr:tripartite tricarboxylate transporter permease [Burkholderiales bacterium]
YIGNVMLLVLNTAFVPAFVAVLRVPYTVLAPLIAIFCVVGVYSVNYSVLDLWIMLGFGVIGYLATKLDYPLAPLVLALVLGKPLEEALRQSLKMSQSDATTFFTRPVSGVIMAMVIAVVLWPLIRRFFAPVAPQQPQQAH